MNELFRGRVVHMESSVFHFDVTGRLLCHVTNAEAALSGSMRPRGIFGNRVFIAERGWDALETAVSGTR